MTKCKAVLTALPFLVRGLSAELNFAELLQYGKPVAILAHPQLAASAVSLAAPPVSRMAHLARQVSFP